MAGTSNKAAFSRSINAVSRSPRQTTGSRPPAQKRHIGVQTTMWTWLNAAAKRASGGGGFHPRRSNLAIHRVVVREIASPSHTPVSSRTSARSKWAAAGMRKICKLPVDGMSLLGFRRKCRLDPHGRGRTRLAA